MIGCNSAHWTPYTHSIPSHELSRSRITLSTQLTICFSISLLAEGTDHKETGQNALTGASSPKPYSWWIHKSWSNCIVRYVELCKLLYVSSFALMSFMFAVVLYVCCITTLITAYYIIKLVGLPCHRDIITTSTYFYKTLVGKAPFYISFPLLWCCGPYLISSSDCLMLHEPRTRLDRVKSAFTVSVAISWKNVLCHIKI